MSFSYRLNINQPKKQVIFRCFLMMVTESKGINDGFLKMPKKIGKKLRLTAGMKNLNYKKKKTKNKKT